MRLSTIGQIAVPVRDLGRATAFYRDALGLTVLFQVPGLAFFDANGIRLMLSSPKGEAVEHGASTLYFRVDDLEQAVRDLQARGVCFKDEPHLIAELADHELWMTFFDDGECSTHALMAEVRR